MEFSIIIWVILEFLQPWVTEKTHFLSHQSSKKGDEEGREKDRRRVERALAKAKASSKAPAEVGHDFWESVMASPPFF